MINRTLKLCMAVMACICALLIVFPVHGYDVQEQLEKLKHSLTPFVQECKNVGVMRPTNGTLVIFQMCVVDNDEFEGLIRKHITVRFDQRHPTFVRHDGRGYSARIYQCRNPEVAFPYSRIGYDIDCPDYR